MLQGKSSMRNVIDLVDKLKMRSQSRRSATDDHNLTLQAYRYEISHYEKQIAFCQDYETPELDKVITKASERNG